MYTRDVGISVDIFRVHAQYVSIQHNSKSAVQNNLRTKRK